MATSTIYRVLGQSNPAATTLTDAYTVSAPVRSAIVSSLNVCNRSNASRTFRISVAKNGAANSNEQYIAYDTPIAANDVMAFNLGMTLAQGDVIRVYASAQQLSFNIFGLENA